MRSGSTPWKRAERAAVVGERGLGQPVGVVRSLGQAAGLQQRVAVLGVAGLALGGAELR